MDDQGNTVMKTFLIFPITLLSLACFAQQDTIWRKGGLFSLTLNQVSLTNWSAGGQNSISGNSVVNYFANYRSGKNSWDNLIDLGYGLVLQGRNGKLLKSDDKIDLTTKYGRAASKKWYYSLLANFRSQFTPGYNYPNDSVVISKFLAPGYLTIAPGMDYKPNEALSVFISPATTRFIFVVDEALSDAGAFGVDTGKQVKTGLGGFLRATFRKDLNAKLNLMTTLDLFSDYLDQPKNVDVNWQMLLVFKLGELLSANLSAQLIYDDNTQLVFYKDDNVTVDHVGPGVQFKEVFGVGFAYKFNRYKVR